MAATFFASRWFRVFRAIFAGLFSLLLLCGISGFWLLGTESGAQFLVRTAMPHLQSAMPENMQLEIHGLETNTMAHLRIGRLSLSDNEGEWLNMEGFSLRWRPAALLRLRLHIEDLGIARLDVLRTPEPLPEPETTLEQDIEALITALETLPDMLQSTTLPPLHLAHLHIDDLALGESILGTASRFRITGKADLMVRPIQLELALDSLEGVETTTRITMQGTERDAELHLRWNEDTGGILGAFLPLATPAPLAIHADSTLQDSILTTLISMYADGNTLLESAIAVPLRGNARIDWTFELPSPALLEPLEDFTSPLYAEGRLQEDGVTLRASTATLPDGLHNASLHAEFRNDTTTPPYALHVEALAYDAPLPEITDEDSKPDNKTNSEAEAETPPTPALHLLLQATGDAERWNIHTLNAAMGCDTKTAAKGALHLGHGSFNLAGAFSLPQAEGHYTAQAESMWSTPKLTAGLQIDTLHVELPAPLDSIVTTPIMVLLANSDSDASNPQFTATVKSEHINGTADIYPSSADALAVGGLVITGLPQTLHLNFRHHADNAGNLALYNDSLQLAVDYRIGDDSVNLNRLSLMADNHINLQGAIALDTATSLATGKLDGYFRSTAPLQSLGIDTPQIQAISGTTTLRLNHAAATQQLRFAYASGSVTLDNEPVASDIQLDATASLPADSAPTFQSSIDITALAYPFSFDTWQVQAQGDADDITWSMRGRNESTDTQFTTRGSVALAEAVRLTLAHLELKWEKHILALQQPAHLDYAPERITLSPLELRMNERGSIKAEANLTDTESRASIQLARLPIGDIRIGALAGVKGMLGGKLNISGTPENPLLDMTMDIKGLQQNYPDTTIIYDQPLTVTLRTSIADGTLKSQLSANAPDAESFAAATAELPFSLSLHPANITATVGDTIDAAFKADLVLGPFLPLLLPDGIYGTGHLVADLRASGALNAPTINGTMSLDSGKIEVLRSGTTVNDIGFQLRANGGRISVTEGKANDGGKGQLSFGGTVDMTPTMPMDTHLDFQNFAIMRHTSAVATMSGKTTLKGDLTDALLQGKWEINSARIAIQGGGGAGGTIPELRVIEVTSLDDPLTELDYRDMTEEERTEAQEQNRRERPFSRNLAMDINIAAENQIYLEGFGLNAELRGKVKIAGVAARPVISGQMETLRGRWAFFGRTFTITRGTAVLSENNLMAPVIDLRTETQADDVLAIAQITGTTDNPDIQFSSIPPLPRDEILARVMFGKNLNNISPFQALQLADMVRTLSGAGGGASLNPLSKLQDTLGIDELKINNSSGTGEDVTVGVGKYVQENVYLEVEGGGAQNSGKVSLEVDLTPNISVETEARQSAESAVRLNYKFDY